MLNRSEILNENDEMIMPLLKEIESDEDISSSVSGIQSVKVMETDSSHSIFFEVVSFANKRYICKIVMDTVLSGTSNSVLYEFRGLMAAHGRQLAPAPIFVDPDRNLLLEEYVDHVNYDTTSLESVKMRAVMGSQLTAATFDTQLQAY
jgi:hypothetical protein